jgi:hypothetical protein
MAIQRPSSVVTSHARASGCCSSSDGSTAQVVPPSALRSNGVGWPCRLQWSPTASAAPGATSFTNRSSGSAKGWGSRARPSPVIGAHRASTQYASRSPSAPGTRVALPARPPRSIRLHARPSGLDHAPWPPSPAPPAANHAPSCHASESTTGRPDRGSGGPNRSIDRTTSRQDRPPSLDRHAKRSSPSVPTARTSSPCTASASTPPVAVGVSTAVQWKPSVDRQRRGDQPWRGTAPASTHASPTATSAPSDDAASRPAAALGTMAQRPETTVPAGRSAVVMSGDGRPAPELAPTRTAATTTAAAPIPTATSRRPPLDRDGVCTTLSTPATAGSFGGPPPVPTPRARTRQTDVRWTAGDDRVRGRSRR